MTSTCAADSRLMTEDEIVDHIISSLEILGICELGTIKYLKSISNDPYYSHHMELGHRIRKYYRLWDRQCPATEPWFTDSVNGKNTHIRAGIDFHPNHPHEVTARIYNKVMTYLKSNYDKDIPSW